MYPNEKRRLPILAKPSDRVSDDIPSPAFDAVIAVFVRTVFLMESGVEMIEPAVEAGSHVRLGIEN